MKVTPISLDRQAVFKRKLKVYSCLPCLPVCLALLVTVYSCRQQRPPYSLAYLVATLCLPCDYLLAGYVLDARLTPFLYLSSIETVQHATHRLGRPVDNL